MLLNTQDGVVDLRNGSIRAHRYEDYFSQITSCGVGEGLPAWIEFLKRVTCGDDEIAGLPAKSFRICTDRQHQRTCAVFSLWQRRQRQVESSSGLWPES